MKPFNFYKPLWKRPVLVTSLALTIPFVVTAVLAPAEETKHKEYVGYIENFNCQASTSCELIPHDGKTEEIAISPYLPLQAGYEIKVFREDSWIEVKLNTGDLIKIHKDHWIVNDKTDKKEKVPYTVSKKEKPFSHGFFEQIEKLRSYFKKLSQDDMNNAGQGNPANAETKGKKMKTISCPPPKTTSTSQNAEKPLEEIISCEKGLSEEARHTLLAGLLVMEKKGDKWKQEANKLLKGIEEDYYPASLVRKELDKKTTAPRRPR